jgi:hypothetical protein
MRNKHVRHDVWMYFYFVGLFSLGCCMELFYWAGTYFSDTCFAL